MKPKNSNKLFYMFYGTIVFIFLSFVACHAAKYTENNHDNNIINSFSGALSTTLSDPLSCFPLNDLSIKYIGYVFFVYLLVIAVIIFDSEKNKDTLSGKEYGSAKWNTNLKKYYKKFAPIPKKNEKDNRMILSQKVFLSMNDFKIRRNSNCIVFGGSGAGKSRFIIKPNILQSNCSYVITDPSGELLESTGSFLESEGYKIKIFNLIDMKHSNCYNPFEYIRDDLGVMMMINCLIQNTTPVGSKSAGDFWEKCETALFQALVFYLIKYRPKEEQNFTTVMKMLRAAEIDENNPNSESPLDKLFDEVKRRDPDSIALKQYLSFKMGAGKTLKSILISCASRIQTFNLIDIENLTSSDNLELGKIGDEKTALFVIIPAADDTYNFLVSMMYSQLFETLYTHASLDCKRKRLPINVRFLLDEFANIGTIPNFTKLLATMRKHGISCTVILQNLDQIKKMYKDDWGSLMGNCDSFVFLGGEEQGILKYISEKLGKATITSKNASYSKGKKGGTSLGRAKMGRELMTPSELAQMPDSDCIVTIRGVQPFYDKKYDYTKHKNYTKTGDYDDKLLFIYSQKPEFDNSKKKKNLSELEIETEKEKAKDIIGVPDEAVKNIIKSFENNKERPGRKKGKIVNVFKDEKNNDNLEENEINTEKESESIKEEINYNEVLENDILNNNIEELVDNDNQEKLNEINNELNEILSKEDNEDFFSFNNNEINENDIEDLINISNNTDSIDNIEEENEENEREEWHFSSK